MDKKNKPEGGNLHMTQMKVKAQEISESDAGPWIDQSRGILMGVEVQNLAQKYGWEGGIIADPQDDAYFSVTYDAENFLQTMAPAGFRFGISEEGDWGLWSFEEVDSEFEEMEMPEDIIPEISFTDQPSPGSASMKIPRFASTFYRTYWKKVHGQGPTTAPPQVTQGQIARWNEAKQQWDVVPMEGGAGSPTAAIAAQVLNHATLGSEFRDELWPEREGSIEVGDRVYVNALRSFGKVVKVEGEAFFVKANVPDLVNPGMRCEVTNKHWGQELERR